MNDYPTAVPLLALCGQKHSLSVKKVDLTKDLQAHVLDLFLWQEEEFRKGREEISFNEDWTNDENEIFFCDVPENVTISEEILNLSYVALPTMSPDEMDDVRGLAIKVEGQEKERILVQMFAPNQILSEKGRLAFGLSDIGLPKKTYVRISSGFQLSNKLACIFEGDRVKFHSLHALSRIVDTSEILSVATDGQVSSFVDDNSEILEIHNKEEFMQNTDSISRKYIASIIKSEVLKNHSAEDIREKAQILEMGLQFNDGKVVVPGSKKEFKEFLRFLTDGRFIGIMSNEVLITNSKRPAP